MNAPAPTMALQDTFSAHASETLDRLIIGYAGKRPQLTICYLSARLKVRTNYRYGGCVCRFTQCAVTAFFEAVDLHECNPWPLNSERMVYEMSALILPRFFLCSANAPGQPPWASITLSISAIRRMVSLRAATILW